MSGFYTLSAREIHFLTHVFRCGKFPKPPENEPLGVRDLAIGIANDLQYARRSFKFTGATEEQLHVMADRLRGTLRDGLESSKFDVSEEAWDQLQAAMRAVNLEDPLPPITPTSFGDLDRIEGLGDPIIGNAGMQTPTNVLFLWGSRIVRGELNLFAANPKVGKTILAIEIARRTWLGIPHYGDTDLVYPKETPSLWILGDRNRSEILKRGKDCGIPEEAFHFVPPGLNLEDPNTVRNLEHYLSLRPYCFVCIDTLWRLTNAKLYDPKELQALLQPFVDLAHRANVAFIITIHTSKDDDALGRRIEAVVRSITKLYHEDDDRVQLTTTINICKNPADLLVTFHDTNLEFRDYSQSQQTGHSQKSSPKPVKQPTKQNEATEFILTALQSGPRLSRELRKEWDNQGGHRKLITRAKDQLVTNNELRVKTDDTGHESWELIDLISEIFQDSDS